MTFKEKRKNKQLSIFFNILFYVFIGLFILFTILMFRDIYNIHEIAYDNNILFTIFIVCNLGLIVLFNILHMFYKNKLLKYLDKIKKYRLNRFFHLAIHAILHQNYDTAINYYNDLIPLDTEQGKVLYNALIFVLPFSSKIEHKKLSKQEIIKILNNFQYNNIFN